MFTHILVCKSWWTMKKTAISNVLVLMVIKVSVRANESQWEWTFPRHNPGTTGIFMAASERTFSLKWPSDGEGSGRPGIGDGMPWILSLSPRLATREGWGRVWQGTSERLRSYSSFILHLNPCEMEQQKESNLIQVLIQTICHLHILDFQDTVLWHGNFPAET